MKGTIDGVPVLVGIVATLLVAVAFVALINTALGLLPHWGDAAITLQRIFAWPFRPVMWLIGAAVERSRRGRDADGHQDGAERIRRLSEFRRAAVRHASRRARG